MRSVNKVIIIGNLTRDPELKQTQNGQSVATFGIATNREWMTSNKERKTSAEFHEVVAWAHLAEICHKYLRKGKLVYLEGYLKTRSWEAETGDKKFRTEIVLQDMIMLEKRGAVSESGEAEPLSSTPEEGIPEEVSMGGDGNQENVF
ncbi:hypothetical protein A3B60_00125 [Candidatus Peregrinibacteria bacterium RIFCSPLOWO2_01_FULL_39_12]|nr:MAG: hypothetical protein A3B60_00125 [Candidatus Peregrinibacteria bacterium RIFCSPLOWO2_01_FULL_39_12]